MNLVWVVPGAGLLAVVFALLMARDVLRRDPGTPGMQAIGGTILEGAMAFLKRQYSTIGILALVVGGVVGAAVGVLGGELVVKDPVGSIIRISALGVAWRTALAFLAGAFCSAISGYIGMYISVKSNVRCASAAQRGLNEAITVALRGGAVSGFLIVALSLLGVTGMYYAYGGRPELAPHLIVGFGFGASFVALFA